MAKLLTEKQIEEQFGLKIKTLPIGRSVFLYERGTSWKGYSARKKLNKSMASQGAGFRKSGVQVEGFPILRLGNHVDIE